MACVWGLLLLSISPNANAFAFRTFTPRTRATVKTMTTETRSTTQARKPTRSARFAAGKTSPWHRTGGSPLAARHDWARRARGDDKGDEDRPYIPGSGLRGVDTKNLTGSDKRDADWFQRTAEREARGELKWFEDPIVYIALFVLVPVFIGVWGVLNCYIPGFCPPN